MDSAQRMREEVPLPSRTLLVTPLQALIIITRHWAVTHSKWRDGKQQCSINRGGGFQVRLLVLGANCFIKSGLEYTDVFQFVHD